VKINAKGGADTHLGVKTNTKGGADAHISGIVPNASFTRHDVSYCSVEEVKIVMFINQIE
jgi:hypothetical protein